MTQTTTKAPMTIEAMAQDIVKSGVLDGAKFMTPKRGPRGWQGISHNDATAAIRKHLHDKIAETKKRGDEIEIYQISAITPTALDIEVRKLLSVHP